MKARINKWTPLFYVIVGLFSIFCVLPVLAVLSISLTDEIHIARNGYSLIPGKFSTLAYQYLFADPREILSAYGVTIFVTVAGSLASLLIISMFAYVLSRQDFKYRNAFSMYVFITMIFSGGLVPTYIVIAHILHLKDTVFALIVPMLVNAYLIIVMRTYFQTIPFELMEAARIDGCREFKAYFSITLPLSTPALATVGMLIMLGFWNDWFHPMMYLSPSNTKLITLQYMLYRIMSNLQFLTQQMISPSVSVDLTSLPNESARMAVCIIAAGPMLVVFPAFQKYFVKGLTIGAVKG